MACGERMGVGEVMVEKVVLDGEAAGDDERDATGEDASDEAPTRSRSRRTLAAVGIGEEATRVERSEEVSARDFVDAAGENP